MTKEKRAAELIETSVVCFLGALVAMLGFFLAWLIASLTSPLERLVN